MKKCNYSLNSDEVGQNCFQESSFISMKVQNSMNFLFSLLEDGLVTPLSLSQDWFPLQTRTTKFPYLQYNPELDYHSRYNGDSSDDICFT